MTTPSKPKHEIHQIFGQYLPVYLPLQRPVNPEIFLSVLLCFYSFYGASVNRINLFVFVRITPIWVLFGRFFVVNLVLNSFWTSIYSPERYFSCKMCSHFRDSRGAKGFIIVMRPFFILTYFYAILLIYPPLST